jgi:hypothetical protein
MHGDCVLRAIWPIGIQFAVPTPRPSRTLSSPEVAHVPAYATYSPGDRVRLKLSEEIGLPAEVVSIRDDSIVRQTDGWRASSFEYQFGKVCITVPIAGVRVPMAVDADQLEPEQIA